MQYQVDRKEANNRSSSAIIALGGRFATWAANGFGSDIYMRVGTRDFWDSNQVAHAMMGFAGTSLTSLTAFWWFGEQYLCIGLLFMILPIWRDTIDCRSSMLKNSARQMIALQSSGN
jgi:hypothetical protein